MYLNPDPVPAHGVTIQLINAIGKIVFVPRLANLLYTANVRDSCTRVPISETTYKAI